MKTISIEIPDGKHAEWVGGVLTLVEDKPIAYKFKVGDKVRTINDSAITYTVTGQFAVDGEPMYNLKVDWGETTSAEKWLELAPQDITKRIKTFEDACKWCNENDNNFLCSQYGGILEMHLIPTDLLAYLKLRIITAALNEGWEPDAGQKVYIPNFDPTTLDSLIRTTSGYYGDSAKKLCFKNKGLAAYAAKQFRDIYADFCGCKKGGEE